MRYLTTYKLFETLDKESFFYDSESLYREMKPDIDDLLGHFHDIGIQSRTETYYDETLYEIYITLTKNRSETYTGGSLEVSRKFINWDEIKDNIHQLISYMNENHKGLIFTECQTQYFTEWKNSHRHITFSKLSDIDKFEGSNKILQVDFTFSRENTDDL